MRGGGATPTDLLTDADSPTLGQPSIDIMPRWTSQTPLPTARSRLALAHVSESWLFAIGGEDSTGSPVARVDVYDLACNEWQDGPTLPLALANLPRQSPAIRSTSPVGQRSAPTTPLRQPQRSVLRCCATIWPKPRGK
ncbi:MAG: kelch repeat-containing protein [Caldilineaceae bacterium]